MGFLTQRQPLPGDIQPPDAACAAGAIERLNQRCGARGVIVRLFEHWCRRDTASRPLQLLVLGRGGVDIARTVAARAQRLGRGVAITVVDRDAEALASLSGDGAVNGAGGEASGRQITAIAADPLAPPFDANSFDYTLASLIGHDLPDLRVMMLLRVMYQLSRRGLVWSDLLRGRWAAAACRWHTRGADPAARHWLVRATAAGFLRGEVMDLRHRMELGFTHYFACGCERFVLAGQR